MIRLEFATIHIPSPIGSLDLLRDIIVYKNVDLGDFLPEDAPAILYAFGDKDRYCKEFYCRRNT